MTGVRRRIAVHHNPLPTYPNAVRLVDRILGQIGIYSEVVAVSESVARTLDEYPERYVRLVSTIANGVAMPQNVPPVNVRERLGIPEGVPLLVNVGRLSPQKNHSLLLRALRNVPLAHLAIIGGGELLAELIGIAKELGISERVHFTGEITPEEVVSFLEASHVFVFPSLWEGLPMAAIEALNVGAAIVASDIPATREVLADAALMVPAGDAPALAAAIGRLLQDPALAAELRLRARRRASRFSVNAMVSAYHQLICK
jgi:glycosyltransferase involved in cell wall biosynthesis